MEANLASRSIDYAKGCYIGQETISRMKCRGRSNKRLFGFCFAGWLAVDAGGAALPDGDEKKEVGWITSAARSKRLGKEIALGYLKRPSQIRFKLDRPTQKTRSVTAVR